MSRPVPVVKMSGAGNDFVVLGPEGAVAVGSRREAWTRRVCRRGLSVGADGVVIVESAGVDRVRVEFRNPDGTPAFCGNGSRCAARFAHLKGLAGPSMTLLTATGEVPAEVRGPRVRLTLPAPVDLGPKVVDLGGEKLHGRWIDAGVPHFVLFVASVNGGHLESWGPRVRRHPDFGSDGTNLDLVERRGTARLAMRTWERGVEAETLSCGSGAVAAALAHALAGGASGTTIVPRGGRALRVRLVGPADRPAAAILEGDARVIFEGLVTEEAED